MTFDNYLLVKVKNGAIVCVPLDGTEGIKPGQVVYIYPGQEGYARANLEFAVRDFYQSPPNFNQVYH